MDRVQAASYIGEMSVQNIWNNVAASIAAIPRSELLMLALAAMVAGWIGAMLVRRKIPMGRILRTGSTLVLAGILVTVVLQLSRFDPRLEVAVPQIGLPEQVVEGGETRVPLAPDGHYWINSYNAR